MYKGKEIELTNSHEVDKCLDTGGFTTKKIAQEILRSKELVETEDDKVTTEKEIVLIWSTEHSQEVYAAKKRETCNRLSC